MSSSDRSAAGGGKKPALGRGLAALIGEKKGSATPPAPAETPAPVSGPKAAVEVDVHRLAVNRHQPRSQFAEASLEELTRSVREVGILQPIVVAPAGDGFTIIAGERRYRAALRAGLTKVPVVLREVDSERRFLELALIENLQRADLNPMEEAEAFRELRDDFHLNQDEIATRVGKDRSSVANKLRLLKLPEEIQASLRSGALSFGHAKAILGIEKEADRLRLAREVQERGLSVREAEQWAAGRPDLVGEAEKIRREPAQKDVFTRDAEEKLSARLRTRVEIVRKKKGGELRLLFASEEELIRLFDGLRLGD
jgi:ParB family chromosome partitioning protein